VADWGLAEWTGRWTGLATGDVDGDGDSDLVVANLGLNTRYRASSEEPYVVYAGDVAGDGGVDVIETEWDSGRLYPLRSAVELGRQIPYFGARFETFLDYARAPVEAVFGAERLAESAARFEAVTLAHTLFLNDGAGHFTPAPLPAAAQLAAAYGVVVQDLDNDGREDIYLVGNFGGPEPQHVVQHDGTVSVWLRGDGAGGFAAEPVSRSGLAVPEEARGLAVADFNRDGWADLAVGVSGGKVKLFANGGVEGNRGLAVRLIGPPGNPHGVGSRVTVTAADGTVRTKEVQAGSSFLSASSPTLIFGLGTSMASEVIVRWPGGAEQRRPAGAGPTLDVVMAP
jgi:hypothetical protein